jgi:hypothetical protein
VLTSLGVTDQTHGVTGLDPGAGGQLSDDGRFDGGVSLKGELLQPFWPGKPGVADAAFGAAAGSVVAFGDHHLRQKPQVGQLLTLGGSSDLGKPVTNGGQAQDATPLLDRGGRRLFGDVAPGGSRCLPP